MWESAEIRVYDTFFRLSGEISLLRSLVRAVATDKEWMMLAHAANVNVPSPVTRRMTVARMEQFELKGAVAA